MNTQSDFLEIWMCFQWFLNGAETREQELVGVYSFMNYLTWITARIVGSW